MNAHRGCLTYRTIVGHDLIGGFGASICSRYDLREFLALSRTAAVLRGRADGPRPKTATVLYLGLASAYHARQTRNSGKQLLSWLRGLVDGAIVIQIVRARIYEHRNHA
jgi:hypothetical protein